ncbi:MAG: hypothetical protein M1835_003952 [Candelina submexicana]|nr:MAG: hypothetical protein M1835_003952 [Candelina submexicana]
MSSSIVNGTLQAAILNATSNILAQVIKAYREDTVLTLDFVRIFQFVLFTVLNCPPNMLWQEYLEKQFPRFTPIDPKRDRQLKRNNNSVSSGQRLDVGNTLKKFLIDQTLGAAVNTVIFVAVMGGFKGLNVAEIAQEVQKNFWPITVAGLKVWPLFSLLAFTVIPVDRRVLAGSLVGVGWSIYLSLVAAG